MPDIPVEIEGNAQRFTVKLPKDGESKTLAPDPQGKRTLEVVGGGKPLHLLVENNQVKTLELALGVGWKITIKEAS